MDSAKGARRIAESSLIGAVHLSWSRCLCRSPTIRCNHWWCPSIRCADSAIRANVILPAGLFSDIVARWQLFLMNLPCSRLGSGSLVREAAATGMSPGETPFPSVRERWARSGSTPRTFRDVYQGFMPGLAGMAGSSSQHAGHCPNWQMVNGLIDRLQGSHRIQFGFPGLWRATCLVQRILIVIKRVNSNRMLH